eukprot:GILJ01011644.1.p1 GENE.GILJ01011644.1~~GILJ01011644.1.p1  ORF type:complete len:1966 (-),score=302.43 GILJ01011644.1:107-5566(-)
MMNLLAKSRRYFGANATQEILDYFRPRLCPHDLQIMKAQATLCQILPTESDEYKLWFEEMFAIWPWRVSVASWDYHFVSLFSRVARDHPEIDWTPKLQFLFNLFLRMFDLPIGASSHYHSSTPMECEVLVPSNKPRMDQVAKLIIHMLRPSAVENNVLDRLSRLMQTVHTYYHPSNEGEWSMPLAQFLQSLVKHYCKRIRRERQEQAPGSGLIRDVLTESIHERFVDIILPSLSFALYGKNATTTYFANLAAKDFSFLLPQRVIPYLLERVFQALENLSASHQTLSSLHTLEVITVPLISKRIFADGQMHIPNILTLTLPGIDPNDASKTQATLRFYYQLFSYVPLMDVSAARDGMSPSNDNSDVKMRDDSLTSFLPYWALQFLEKILVVVSCLDDPGAYQSDFENAFSVQLGTVLRLFFNQMGNDVYDQALDILFTFVTSNIYVNSLKEIGLIVSAATIANPRKALDKFLLFFYRRLVDFNPTVRPTSDITSSDEKGGKKLALLSEPELRWYLRILNKLVRVCGSELLRFKGELTDMIEVSLTHTDRKIKKLATTLIRNILEALTLYAPKETKCFPSHIWNDPNFQSNHPDYWGTQYSFKRMSDTQLEWNTPTAEGIAFANELVDKYLKQPILFIADIVKAPVFEEYKNSLSNQNDLLIPSRSTVSSDVFLFPVDNVRTRKVSDADSRFKCVFQSVSREDLISVLSQVKQVVKGAAAILPEITDSNGINGLQSTETNTQFSKQPNHPLTELYDRFLAPPPPPRMSCGLLLSPSDNMSQANTRRDLCIFLHNFLSFLVANELDDDLSLLLPVLKIIQFLLSYRGVNQKKVDVRKAIFSQFKKRHTSNMAADPGYSRGFIALRSILQHQLRIATSSYESVITSYHTLLLDDLMILSMHSYSKVRIRAQSVLTISLASLHDYAPAVRRYLPLLLSCLGQKNEKPERINGSVHLLQSPVFLLELVFDWSLFRQFAISFCKSSQHEKLSVQSRLMQVFLVSCSTFESLKIRCPVLTQHSSILNRFIPELTSAGLNSIRESLQDLSHTNKGHFDMTVQELLSLHSESGLHWRYELIIASFLLLLIGSCDPQTVAYEKRITVPDSVKVFFLRGLVSDVNYMRMLCCSALNAILPLIKPIQPRITVEQSELTRISADSLYGQFERVSEDSWNDRQFTDKNWFGWFLTPKVYTKYIPSLKEEKRWPTIEVAPPLVDSDVNMEEQESSPGQASGQLSDPSPLGSQVDSSTDWLVSVVSDGAYLKKLVKYLCNDHSMDEDEPNQDDFGLDLDSSQMLQMAGDIVSNLLTADRGELSAKAWASDLFVEDRAQLVKGLFQILGPPFMHAILPLLSELCSAFDHREKQSSAAEVIAGMIRGAKHWDWEDTQQLIQVCVPLILPAMVNCSMEVSDDWCSLLSFIAADLDPKRLYWLIPYLFDSIGLNSSAVTSPTVPVFSLSSVSSSLQLKSLRMIQPIIAQWSWRSLEICEKLLDWMENSMSSPTKQIRDEIAVVVSIIISNSFAPRVDPTDLTAEPGPYLPHPRIANFVQNCIQKVNSLDGEQLSRFKLTLLSWIATASHSNGGAALSPYFDTILPFLLGMQDESDPNIIPIARNCLAFASLVFLPQRLLPTALEQIRAASMSPSWRVRQVVCSYIQIFCFEHSFLLEDMPVDTMVPLLCDTQIEVQTAASDAVSSLVRMMEMSKLDNLVQHFLALARTPIVSKRKREGSDGPTKTSDEAQLHFRQRHGGLLGLAAVVYAFPYDVPKWMPSVLAEITTHRGDPNPIRSTVSKCIAEFWRTHKEMWVFFKPLFSEEQLEALSELFNPYNYYA